MFPSWFPTSGSAIQASCCSWPGRAGISHVDSSGNNEWVRWMPYPLTLTDLFVKFLDTVGPERVLLAPILLTSRGGLVRAYYDEQVRIVTELGLSTQERHLVFAGNAARLLGLPDDSVPRVWEAGDELHRTSGPDHLRAGDRGAPAVDPHRQPVDLPPRNQPRRRCCQYRRRPVSSGPWAWSRRAATRSTVHSSGRSCSWTG